MPTTDGKLRVFLCHSSHDKPTVRELYQRLNAEGWIDAWLDAEKLYPGQDWNFEIERAVEASDVIIVCLSKNSVTKEGYVQRELRIILDIADYKPEGTLFIIPVRLEECEPPRRLKTWQFADYFPKEDQGRAYARLLVSLRMRAMRLGISTVNTINEKARREADEQAKARRLKEESERRDAEEMLRRKQVEEKLARELSENRAIKNDRFQYDGPPIVEDPRAARTNLIPVIILILLCVCTSTLGFWYYGDQILQLLGP